MEQAQSHCSGGTAIQIIACMGIYIMTTDKYERQKRYLQTQDEIKVRLTAGNRAAIQEYAKSHGWKSVNQFIINAMDFAISNQFTAAEMQQAIRDRNKS